MTKAGRAKKVTPKTPLLPHIIAAVRAATGAIAFLVEDQDSDCPTSLAEFVEGLLDQSLRDSIDSEVVGAAVQCAKALEAISEHTKRSIADLLAAAETPDDLATLRASSESWWT